MKLGICGVQVVNAGDDVTEEMKAILGRNRLKLWWECKRVALKDFDGDLGRVGKPAKKKTASKKKKAPKISQENLDSDHNLGGPAEEPELRLPRLDTPPDDVSPF